MRLIDGDALVEVLKNRSAELSAEGLHLMAGVVAGCEVFARQAPTIDAVPVVRCKECVHAKPIPDAKANYFDDGVKCCEILRGDETYGVSVVWDEGYCDDGQRKEDAP